jgi:hypothetical protein
VAGSLDAPARAIASLTTKTEALTAEALTAKDAKDAEEHQNEEEHVGMKIRSGAEDQN